MPFQIRYTSDGRIIPCRSPISAKDLLHLMARESVTLARVLPLHGEVQRAYRLVRSVSELLDLEQYVELYNANRRLIGFIEAQVRG